MVYGTPIEQLKDRRDDLQQRERGPNAIVYAADGMYHNMCILGRSEQMKISSKHPAVKVAQELYVQALDMEADGAEPAEVARKILHATSKLQEIIFADFIL